MEKRLAKKAIAFDTLAYVKKLRGAGVPKAQAEVQAETIAELIEDRIATKADLMELELVMREIEASLRRDMKEMEINLRKDLKTLESGLRQDMEQMKLSFQRGFKDLEPRMMIKLGGIMVTGIAVIVALQKLL